MLKIALLPTLLLLSYSTQAQNINVYFNQSVDNTASPNYNATSSSHLEDSISTWINNANTSIDLAVWDNGSSTIVTAINNAQARGLRIRYITSSNSSNSALSNLNAAIPTLERNAGLTSNVMHNKFLIIDNQELITGSMNWGNGSMHDDYNNIVRLRDSALAQNYKIEFEEMWGSSNAQSNTNNSKFGPDKSDNTNHNFTIGGKNVELYFSPTDQTSSHIIAAINSAEHSLDIAMFTFIHNGIGDAVVAAKNRGVAVRCIIENVSYFGSEYNKLINNGIDVASHASVAFDLHHKYCIVDAMHSSADPIVVTESHNWTNSAEDEYDENTLIIHSEAVAQQYLEEFSRRWQELRPTSLAETQNFAFALYPNPNKGNFVVETTSPQRLEIYDILGRWRDGIDLAAGQNNCYFALPAGTYFAKANQKTIAFVIE